MKMLVKGHFDTWHSWLYEDHLDAPWHQVKHRLLGPFIYPTFCWYTK